MKLHAQPSSALNAISGYGANWIAIHGTRYPGAILVAPQGTIESWEPIAMAAITPAHLAKLAERGPDLILLGTGTRQHFLPAQWLAALQQHAIGIEMMDTAAACRTFNILVAEGRRVLAALLPWLPEAAAAHAP